jgi:hypothetical protein
MPVKVTRAETYENSRFGPQDQEIKAIGLGKVTKDQTAVGWKRLIEPKGRFGSEFKFPVKRKTKEPWTPVTSTRITRGTAQS